MLDRLGNRLSGIPPDVERMMRRIEAEGVRAGQPVNPKRLRGLAQKRVADERRQERETLAAQRKHERVMRSQTPIGLTRRETLKRLADQQEGLCGICGEVLGNLWMCNVDHIVPQGRGGSDVWSNLQATHITCNSRKADHLGCGPEAKTECRLPELFWEWDATDS